MRRDTRPPLASASRATLSKATEFTPAAVLANARSRTIGVATVEIIAPIRARPGQIVAYFPHWDDGVLLAAERSANRVRTVAGRRDSHDRRVACEFFALISSGAVQPVP